MNTNPSAEYFAAYFDAEGCVHLQKPYVMHDRKGKLSQPRIVVALGNTFLPILEIGQRIYGGCLHISNKTKLLQHRNKPFHQWRLQGRAAAHFLTDISPFLIEKWEKANAALFLLDSLTWPKDGSRLAKETLQMRQICQQFFATHPNN